jgi:hypothetical protein
MLAQSTAQITNYIRLVFAADLEMNWGHPTIRYCQRTSVFEPPEGCRFAWGNA